MDRLKKTYMNHIEEGFFNNEETDKRIRLLYKSINWTTDAKYNNISRFINYLVRLDKNPTNFEIIIMFLKEKRVVQQVKLGTLNRMFSIWFKFNHYDWNKLDKDEVEAIFMQVTSEVNMVNQNPTSIYTREKDWAILKELIEFTNEDINLRKFKIRGKRPKLHFESLMTPDEFQIIFERLGVHQYGKGLEYQTYWLCEGESGPRFGEVLSLTKKNFKEFHHGYIADVWDKSVEDRPMYFYKSGIFLKKLFDQGWIRWTFDYFAFYRQLKRVSDKLKQEGSIRREVNVKNHLLRHNFATYIATIPEISDSEKREIMGWSPDSKMLKFYEHLDKKKILEKNYEVIENNPLLKDLHF